MLGYKMNIDIEKRWSC